MSKFSAANIADLTGKTFVVTGATNGLGLQSAMAFAAKGARVIVHGRSHESASTAARDITSKTGNTQIVPVHADLGSLAQVKEMSLAIAEAAPKIDVLLLNAGIGAIQHRLTVDGIETAMAVNHVAHFYMLKRLESTIRASKTRVVSVSAGSVFAAPKGGFYPTLEAWNDKATYSDLTNFAMSKTCVILTSQAIAEKWGKDGVVAVVTEPGAVLTGAVAKADGKGFATAIFRNLAWTFASSPEEGAKAQIYACTAPASEIANNSGFRSNLKPWDLSKIKVDNRAERLWTLTESVLAAKGFN
ncbi:hypothetical protein BC831DRAFT_476712 [Entophlyctis helioformis]|nr:hypothetical protein BC831DRAFT_476712 [Entophlyctis helioformis]